MIKILSFEVPGNKAFIYSIRYIKGIGLTKAKSIADIFKISYNVKMQSVPTEKLHEISSYIRDNITTDFEMVSEVRNNVLNQIKMGTYRGDRHKRRMPVNGQNTATNGRTARKIKVW